MTQSEPSYILRCPPASRDAMEPLFREFAVACRSMPSPRIEDFLQRYHGPDVQVVLHELLLEEIEHRTHRGEIPKASDYEPRFPEYAEVLREVFTIAAPSLSESNLSEPLAAPLSELHEESFEEPTAFGRYRVIKKLGRGGFGTVYLAHDPDLDRNVAIKLPRRDRFRSIAEMDLFVQEARMTAKLGGHPGIVTLYDIQTLGDSICIIQEFVNGHDLRTLLHAHPNGLSIDRCVEIIIAVGAAMAFAHEKGFYHRDLKPDNVLIDTQGVPRIADFGLAIHEDQQRKRKGDKSGSPHYMSPERIRGESHRIDGRSDLWSLGVVFYELLTGRRPFQGDTREALAEEICHREPVPIRQWRPEVPSELDRICTKCLSKHKSDRYPTAHDLLEDLHWWTTHRASTPATDQAVSALSPIPTPTPFPTPSSSGQRRPLGNSDTPNSGSGGTPGPKAIPKGLRAFDREDREFFMELLPGPHDRHGLPESIRFWKSRIEELQPDRTFAVGLLYGPSGCGKTSLVKAGLLPRLADRVRAIYIGNYHAPLEATLKKSLLRMFPDLPRDSDAAELLQFLCRGGWMANDQKLLLVLDQFEQWLHTTPRDQRQPITDALRQCDGSHVQTLLMSRSDFWMETTRFMRDLEAPIAEGENIAAVDLFSILHAKKVLELFGRAYGRFPENETVPLSHEQQAFLEQSLRSLSDEDKVIPVKLALFAELLKEQPWTPATLEAVGGLEGLGSLFLEQSFDAKHADVESKYHHTAARGVLRALLPDGNGSIRNSQKSFEELRGASGYGNSDKELQSLIELLDRKLRLITPVIDGSEPQSETSEPAASLAQAGPSYQLAHDYLIPSLRDWLQRKQRETTRGRAELALEDRTAIWKFRRENKHLPTFLEWLSIHRWVPKRLWTPVQHDAMRAADRMHWIRIGIASLGCIALGATAWTVQQTRQEKQRSQTAEREAKQELRTRNLMAIASADANKIVSELDSINPSREEYATIIRDSIGQFDPASQQNLNLRLASLRWDEDQIDSVLEWSERASTSQLQAIAQCVRPHHSRLSDAQKERFGKRLIEKSLSDSPIAFASLFVAHEEFFRDAVWMDHLKEHCVSTEALSENPFIDSNDGTDLNLKILSMRRRAIAALALLVLGQTEPVDAFLSIDDDPEALTQFVAAVPGRITKPDVLATHLDALLAAEVPSDASERRRHYLRLYAMLLAMGEFTPSDFSESVRTELVERFASLYATHPSRVVHSTLGWLLLRWNRSDLVTHVDHNQVAIDPTLEREWYIEEIDLSDSSDMETPIAPRDNHGVDPSRKVYFTMLAFPAGRYALKDNRGKLVELHAKLPFAVCDREISWEQYGAFTGDSLQRSLLAGMGRTGATLDERLIVPTAPAVAISWQSAAEFFEKLSTAAGIQATNQSYTYKFVKPSQGTSNRSGNPTRQATYIQEQMGFRLPNAAEWLYVASGGMSTNFSFGSDATRLHDFEWFIENKSIWQPGELLRPNPFGLFDVHGSVSEWTNDKPQGPVEGRFFGGGNRDATANSCRANFLQAGNANQSVEWIGFRIARTLSITPNNPNSTDHNVLLNEIDSKN